LTASHRLAASVATTAEPTTAIAALRNRPVAAGSVATATRASPATAPYDAARNGMVAKATAAAPAPTRTARRRTERTSIRAAALA
jgi:hypothetical protein